MFAPALLELPVLEEMIGAMTISRYHHASDDQGWSNEALSFLSWSRSGSLQNLINVSNDPITNGCIMTKIALFPEKSCITEETNTSNSIYS